MCINHADFGASRLTSLKPVAINDATCWFSSVTALIIATSFFGLV